MAELKHQVTDHELEQMLIKIAHADLEEGASIYDHPCSVAIRRIRELAIKEPFLERDEINLILSFLPETNDPVPMDLSPMFYHTLDYEKEVKLYSRVSDVREKLAN